MSVDFEALYRADPDPWGYCSSPYERTKYADTLAACEPGPFHHALELGSSIGIFSALLAPRCERLTTIDLAPTAVTAARARLHGLRHVETILGAIPDEIPDGPFDLVLASEILYYLPEDAFARTLQRLETATGPGATLVAVHWRPPGPERPRDACEAHDALRAQPWLTAVRSGGSDEYLLDVLART